MYLRNRSNLLKLFITVAIVGGATLIHLLLERSLGSGVPFILYYPAVVLSAWSGGLRFGILSVLLSAIVSSIFFIDPQHALGISDPAGPVRLAVFIISGILISLLAEDLHKESKKSHVSETLEKDEREKLQVILSSIGDGVIATDAEGRVVFMNRVAESLTRWTEEEATGKNLAEVCRIINEETRVPVNNPALLAMKEGISFGLANHSVLVRKDGTEIPIDDSGAPIRNSHGKTIGAVLIFRDITDRRRDEQTRALLSYIVQSSDDAIIGKNLEGIVSSWNAAAERMFGWTAIEAIGRPITIIIPEDRLREEKDILERLRRGERIDHFETTRVAKDGRKIDLSLTISPIRDSNGRIIGASKIARDITELKRAAEERVRLLQREKAARTEAEAANRTKDEFLATVSHELRTPLNAILGWVRLLSAGALEPSAVTRAIETIEQSAKAQSRLIDDLLDVSRITSGKLQLNFEPVDIVRIIEATLDTMRPVAETKSIHIVSKLNPPAGIIVGDSTRLQQVIWNLVSNAVKFTPIGGRIEVRLDRTDSEAEISVEDTGIGISPEFLPHLFEAFRQADGKDTRRHGGLGLGLAIVRHLVEMHGGTASAKSRGEGRGSTFIVRLPIKAAQVRAGDQLPEPARPRMVAEQLPRLHRVRALVVDDEASARDIVTAVLKQCGAEVTAVSSAAEALSALTQWQPNVLVSDIAMPEQNGYELISKIRTLKPQEGGNIPAVALTAYAKADDRLKALAAGFQSHLAKPFEPGELALVVANLVQLDKQSE